MFTVDVKQQNNNNNYNPAVVTLPFRDCKSSLFSPFISNHASAGQGVDLFYMFSDFIDFFVFNLIIIVDICLYIAMAMLNGNDHQ